MGEVTPKIQHLRQPDGSSLCFAVCVAMVSGDPIARVVKKCEFEMEPPGFDAYLSVREAAKYLAARDLSYGFTLTPLSHEPGTPIGKSWYFDPLEYPAIVHTNTGITRDDECHAVVWCPIRQKILDPLYKTPRSLNAYSVLEWVPIMDLL